MCAARCDSGKSDAPDKSFFPKTYPDVGINMGYLKKHGGGTNKLPKIDYSNEENP